MAKNRKFNNFRNSLSKIDPLEPNVDTHNISTEQTEDTSNKTDREAISLTDDKVSESNTNNTDYTANKNSTRNADLTDSIHDTANKVNTTLSNGKEFLPDRKGKLTIEAGPYMADLLERAAYWDRTTIKNIVMDLLEAYFEGKKYDPVPEKHKLARRGKKPKMD